MNKIEIIEWPSLSRSGKSEDDLYPYSNMIRRKGSIKMIPNHNRRTSDYEKAAMKLKIAKAQSDIIKALGFDSEDPNLKDTPNRIARMLVDELYWGCFNPEPKITTFPNTKNVDQMIMVGPIKVKSSCAHHGLSFIGEAYIGMIPDEKLIGLSKYARIVNWYARRPQIQEELTEQIVEYIQNKMNPKGCGVYITSKHLCMACRGVEEENSFMDTVGLRGIFLDEASTKQEFFKLVDMKIRR